VTTTSRIPAVIDALVSTFAAALPNVQVFDGPWITVPDSDYLTVGWTPAFETATGQQTWAGLGNKARDEQIDVPCYCDSFSGATTVSDRRNAAFAMFAAAETAIRNDPTLGGVIPNPGWAQIGTYNDRTEQTEAGVEVGVVFHVLVQTRI
jgi:hypothetical protein